MFSGKRLMHALSLVAAVSLWIGIGTASAEKTSRLSPPEGKLLQQFSRPKQEFQTAQSSRCRHPDTPRYCPGLNWCCPSTHTHACSGYRGYYEPYRRFGSATFCVQPNSNQDWVDLSQNCAVFTPC